MKNFKFILLISTIFISLGLTQCTLFNNDVDTSSSTKGNLSLISPDEKAKNLIENYYIALNNKDEQSLQKYTNSKSNFRTSNIKNSKLDETSFISDKKQYELISKENNIPIENINLYNVRSTTEYIDESMEPVSSGSDSKLFILVKELNGNWIIFDIGDGS